MIFVELGRVGVEIGFVFELVVFVWGSWLCGVAVFTWKFTG